MRAKLTRSLVAGLISLAIFVPLAAGQAAGQAPAVNAAAKLAIIDEIASLLNGNYIFPETAKKVEEALRAKLKAGAFDAAADARAFAQAVSRTILDVGKDRHMGFSYNPAAADDQRKMMGQSEEERRKVRDRQLREMEVDNFGFRKVERLAGNIGYLDFRVFESPDAAGPTAIAAMNFLAYCDAIIVDLRQNGGGEPAMIQLLCTYFFDEMTHLNDIFYRADDRVEHYWTLPFVPGPRPSRADLYILTSSRTFSGAEEFTYNMKNLKRGVVIGETTGGGAHPTQDMIVAHDYMVRVPFARSVNPYSKTNWEGTGVAPDVACPATEAYDRALAMALEKLAAKAKDPEKKAGYEALAKWQEVGRAAKANPPRLDAKTLASYAGEFGLRILTYENGALYYQRTGGAKAKLAPLSATLFAPEGVDGFRIEVVLKDGKATEIVGVYENGVRQPSPRTK